MKKITNLTEAFDSLKTMDRPKILKEDRKTLGSKNRNRKDTAVDLCVSAMNAIEELFDLNGKGYIDLPDIISSEESQTLNKAIEILDKIGYDIEIRLDEPDYYDESLNKKTSLKEARWSYTLKSGSELRSAINDEDPMGVIFALQNAYAELRDAGIIDEDDFDSYTGDFELYEEDDDDIEETADYELDNFYDLCDALKVWIPLD